MQELAQNAFEVLSLLRNGFADGAHARWRTLHEIAVICSLLSEHGNEVAERFLLYEVIQSYFDADKHKKNYKGRGEPPLSDEEFGQLARKKDELEQRFGRNFSSPNGWAKSILDDTRFASIEKSVGMEHLRPYFNLANINIHAGSKGLYFRLGNAESGNVMLAGPSSHGLIDPADGAAISINQVTTFTLSNRINSKRLASLQALQRKLDDLHSHFDNLLSMGVR